MAFLDRNFLKMWVDINDKKYGIIAVGSKNMSIYLVGHDEYDTQLIPNFIPINPTDKAVFGIALPTADTVEGRWAAVGSIGREQLLGFPLSSCSGTIRSFPNLVSNHVKALTTIVNVPITTQRSGYAIKFHPFNQSTSVENNILYYTIYLKAPNGSELPMKFPVAIYNNPIDLTKIFRQTLKRRAEYELDLD